MHDQQDHINQTLPRGVMLNAYPDSIGSCLSDTIALLKRPEFENAFSLFYILPTFFHSDLDRGFSIIDYDLNEALVSPDDLKALDELGIQVKLDLVLNHLSVRSPQFQDLLRNGERSLYKDFFIDWDDFWKEHGTLDAEGQVIPDRVFLDKLFMRKPSLPILKVRFPDGALKTYWNTFYQKVDFAEITALDFADIEGLGDGEAESLADQVKIVIRDKGYLEAVDLENVAHLKDEIIRAVCGKREYLGQMDLNARSELVWKFYDDTLRKLSGYGAKIIRLDAFAYLHKEPGATNFFNRPGTWIYLQRLKSMAQRYGLTIFPEIHAEYGADIHAEIAEQGFPFYDFYFPGLVIHALENGENRALVQWIKEIASKGLQTINMLGCHDGIPVLDLRGKHGDSIYRSGLLSDEQIDATVQCIIDRGGLTKNLYDANGKKIDYYQVNATFFSALGEDEHKLLLARAIQMFMPGVPQVWYLDLFAGTNDYAAAQGGRTAGHKEINRTTLQWPDIEAGLRRKVVLDQLALIRFRNSSPSFNGELEIMDAEPHRLGLRWRHPDGSARLDADLREHSFSVYQDNGSGERVVVASGRAGDPPAARRQPEPA